MELVNLMKCMSDNNIPHYMIWFGEEQKILDIYLSKICEIYKPIYIATVSNVIKQLDRKSLDKSKKVYIVNSDTSFMTAESSWKNVQDKMNKSDHILLLRYTKIDKKCKFYTNNKQNCTQFEHLSDEVLQLYINRILTDFTPENSIKLIGMCGNDYGRILLEIDKIQNYMQYHKAKDSNAVFNILLSQNAIYSDIGDITFQLTDAILYGDYKKSVNIMMDAKRKEEPALMIASILYNGFRNMLSYQSLGKNKKDAINRTGLQYWQIKQCEKNEGGYTIQELIRNINLCQWVESGIKMGIIDDDIALEYMIVNCLR